MEISPFRASRNFHVNHLVKDPPHISFIEHITVDKVGGILGIGASKSITEIKMTNNMLVPGEKAKVTIRCDNSKCS